MPRSQTSHSNHRTRSPQKIGLKITKQRRDSKISPWVTKEDNKDNMNLDLEALELSPKSQSQMLLEPNGTVITQENSFSWGCSKEQIPPSMVHSSRSLPKFMTKSNQLEKPTL